MIWGIKKDLYCSKNTAVKVLPFESYADKISYWRGKYTGTVSATPLYCWEEYNIGKEDLSSEIGRHFSGNQIQCSGYGGGWNVWFTGRSRYNAAVSSGTLRFLFAAHIYDPPPTPTRQRLKQALAGGNSCVAHNESLAASSRKMAALHLLLYCERRNDWMPVNSCLLPFQGQRKEFINK